MNDTPIEIEIINVKNVKELPKVSMSVRVEPKGSDWRPADGHWFKWTDSFGCIHWHRELEA